MRNTNSNHVGNSAQKNCCTEKLSHIFYVLLLGIAAILALCLKHFASELVLNLVRTAPHQSLFAQQLTDFAEQAWFQFGCIDNNLVVPVAGAPSLVCGGNQAVYR